MYNIILIITDTYRYDNLGARSEVMPVRTPELYDLTVDPLAANDISAGNKKIVKKMHNLFISHLKKYNAPADALQCWE